MQMTVDDRDASEDQLDDRVRGTLRWSDHDCQPMVSEPASQPVESQWENQMGEGRHAEQEGENRLPAAKQDHRDKG